MRRARDVFVAVDEPPPLVFGAGPQADAHAVAGTARRSDAIVHDHDPAIAGHEIGTVERAVETERLAQLGGTAAQVTVAGGHRSASRAHGVETAQGLGRAQ
jgi:hypothetical protein